MDLASLIWSLASSIQPRNLSNRAEATHSLTNDAAAYPSLPVNERRRASSAWRATWTGGSLSTTSPRRRRPHSLMVIHAINTAGNDTTAKLHWARKNIVQVHRPSLSASVAIKFC